MKAKYLKAGDYFKFCQHDTPGIFWKVDLRKLSKEDKVRARGELGFKTNNRQILVMGIYNTDGWDNRFGLAVDYDDVEVVNKPEIITIPECKVSAKKSPIGLKSRKNKGKKNGR